MYNVRVKKLLNHLIWINDKVLRVYSDGQTFYVEIKSYHLVFSIYNTY